MEHNRAAQHMPERVPVCRVLVRVGALVGEFDAVEELDHLFHQNGVLALARAAQVHAEKLRVLPRPLHARCRHALPAQKQHKRP